MTEIEKKGLDYFNKQIEKGNINVLVMIGELLEKNQKTQNYYENGLDDINNDYSYRIKQLQKENEELKNQLLSNSLQLKSTTEKNSEVKELKTLAENRQVFIDWIFNHYPDIAQEYLNQQK